LLLLNSLCIQAVGSVQAPARHSLFKGFVTVSVEFSESLSSHFDVRNCERPKTAVGSGAMAAIESERELKLEVELHLTLRV
jgi:hypothetical protein